MGCVYGFHFDRPLGNEGNGGRNKARHYRGKTDFADPLPRIMQDLRGEAGAPAIMRAVVRAGIAVDVVDVALGGSKLERQLKNGQAKHCCLCLMEQMPEQRPGLVLDGRRKKFPGYITDQWPDWQQGGCGAYAGVLSGFCPWLEACQLDDGGHFYMTDGTWAYDSAGRHKMPYYGLGYPYPKDSLEEGIELADHTWIPEYGHPEWNEAVAHLLRNGILQIARADHYMADA